MSGRFVIVQMDNGNDPLNLKEVKAFGNLGNITKFIIVISFWNEEKPQDVIWICCISLPPMLFFGKWILVKHNRQYLISKRNFRKNECEALLGKNWKHLWVHTIQLWTKWSYSHGGKFCFGNWALKAILASWKPVFSKMGEFSENF